LSVIKYVIEQLAPLTAELVGSLSA
jgi:hypothetical protein